MCEFATAMRAARDEFQSLGFDTFPLLPGTKRPYTNSWQTRQSLQLWRGAPADANIAIRTGGISCLAVIDADDKNQPGSADAILRYLDGLGYSYGTYPIVQTASQVGRHFYVRFLGTLADAFLNLAPGLAGEFRCGPGAYVVAPPSRIGDAGYRLMTGDFRQLPALTAEDVSPLISGRESPVKPNKSTPGVPRSVWGLLKGIGTQEYKSRSEIDQAIIVRLINAGHDFSSVLYFFRDHEPPKYKALRIEVSEQEADRWLRRSFDNAFRFTSAQESAGRQAAASAMQWLQCAQWPGPTRTIVSDRTVFRAHVAIAHKSGKLVYAASCRDLAEIAGVNRDTATRATQRLLALGLIVRQQGGTSDLAARYKLGQLQDTPSRSEGGGSVSKLSIDLASHDAFRWRGLGKRCAEVLALLYDHSASDDEIAKVLGCHVKTVQRALDRLATILDPITGEVVHLVQKDVCHWHALVADLDRVAEIVGTSGDGERQRRQHESERWAHQRYLEAQKTKSADGGRGEENDRK